MSLYLWLGAFELRGKGLCSRVFSHIEQTTSYRRWCVKTEPRNFAALGVLKKHKFEVYDQDGGTLYMERWCVA
jgi:hypothetical protein